jgi:alkylation response protein AidB-like acyl-CoA dehydrogenase
MSTAPLFDLTPTEEQQMTRDVVQRFARDEIAPTARPADEAGELPQGFLRKTMELGLNFMPVPEAMGGAGGARSSVANVLSMEDLAQGDMSMAAAAMAPLSVINCVLDSGTEEQQARVASTLLAEYFVPAALAAMEPGIGFDLKHLTTKAIEQVDGSYQLSGCKSMVAFGPEAKVIVAFASVTKRSGVNLGTQCFLLEGNTAGLSFEREDYMGLRPLPLYSMVMENVSLPASAKLPDEFDVKQFHNLSKIASAALAVGTCQAVLDYVVPYVNERVAFGEPISHRQSVAFMVADMTTELEALRLMVYRAAAQAEQSIDCTRMAFLAHRQAIKYGKEIGSNGVQLLGGHGFIREHPVELWYRNLQAIATLDGLLFA